MLEYKKEIVTLVAVVTILLMTGAGVVYILIPSTPVTVSTTTRTQQISPTGPKDYAGVEITSVQLINSTMGSVIHLNTTVKNTGTLPIFFYAGGASSLSITWNPNSAIKATSTSPPYCSLPGVQMIVQPGQIAYPNFLACNNRYTYTLQQAGTVSINLTLEWRIVNGSDVVYVSHYSKNYTVT